MPGNKALQMYLLDCIRLFRIQMTSGKLQSSRRLIKNEVVFLFLVHPLLNVDIPLSRGIFKWHLGSYSPWAINPNLSYFPFSLPPPPPPWNVDNKNYKCTLWKKLKLERCSTETWRGFLFFRNMFSCRNVSFERILKLLFALVIDVPRSNV